MTTETKDSLSAQFRQIPELEKIDISQMTYADRINHNVKLGGLKALRQFAGLEEAALEA